MTTLDELHRLGARLLGERAEATLCGVRLRQFHAPGAPMSNMTEMTFGLLLQGRKRTVAAGRVFDYGPGDSMPVSLALPVTGQVTQASPDAPYLMLGWALDPAAIAGLVLEAGEAAVSNCRQALAVHAAGPDLVDALARLPALAERPDDAAILRPLLEKEILWRLLRSPHGALLRQLGLADSRLARVSRAIHWLRSHYAEPVRIELLEAVSGLSSATLFRHFEAFTSMSPPQYEKQIRQLEARTRIAVGALDVAWVAYEVGYESPSQFAREYARQFGRPPRTDLRRPHERAA